MNREAQDLESTDNDVASVVSGLSHVKAPTGFERQVMTRIADGAPPRRLWLTVPGFAYVIPALIALLIATFLIFRSQPAATNEQNIVVQNPPVSSQQRNEEVAAQTTESNAAIQQTTTQNPETVQRQVKQDDRNLNSNGNLPGSTDLPMRAGSNNNSGKAIDYTLKQAQGPLPEGISPKPQRRTPDANSIISSASVPVVDILGMLGMTVKYESDWKVTAVSANSAARRSGVLSGDVVTAINDRQLTSDTAYNGSASFTSITVRRGSETIVIKLK